MSALKISKTQWKKEALLIASNFSSSHSIFYTSGELSAIFILFKIVACKLFFKFLRDQHLLFQKGLISEILPQETYKTSWIIKTADSPFSKINLANFKRQIMWI